MVLTIIKTLSGLIMNILREIYFHFSCQITVFFIGHIVFISMNDNFVILTKYYKLIWKKKLLKRIPYTHNLF